MGHFAQGFDDFLRLDDSAVALVVREHLAIATPFVDLLPPGIQRRLVRLLADFLEDTEHFAEHAVDRADNRHVGLDHLGDRRRVDVDVDDLGVRAELGRAVDHTVVEACAHSEDHVGVVHGHVGGVAAVHAEHAEELAVGTREATEAHQGIGDRQVQRLGNFGQGFGATAEDHATAGVDDRALGRQQHFGSLADLAGVATDRRAVGAQLDLFRVDVFELLSRVGHIFWNVDHDWTWTTGLRQVESFFQNFRDLGRILDHEAVLHDRPRDTDHVSFLEGIGAHHGARHLAGQNDHRNRVHVGGGNTGNGIGCARTGGYQHHTGLAGGASVTVRHMGGRLLVTNQDVFHFRFFEQCVVNMQESTTRVPVDVLNAFVTQEADDHLSAR